MIGSDMWIFPPKIGMVQSLPSFPGVPHHILAFCTRLLSQTMGLNQHIWEMRTMVLPYEPLQNYPCPNNHPETLVGFYIPYHHGSQIWESWTFPIG